MPEKTKIIISGGGTGGHIYPAISIANAVREKYPDTEILFVGAEGRMEMEKVPEAGYDIVGLPVIGLSRKLSWRLLSFVFKLWASMRKARKILKNFSPHAVIGVGGYASGPLLKAAQKKGIPALIQEQNSYPGITNRLLGKHAQRICVAYDGLERYFPKDKIVFTGNPVRQDILKVPPFAREAYAHFNLSPDKPVVLAVGGSLGARTINNSLLADLKKFTNAGVQVLWQTGKLQYDSIHEALAGEHMEDIHYMKFIRRMDYAFSVANIVVSRAGASTISELCLVKKPAIFVPSPNVAEDHQRKNALALTKIHAAHMVEDSEAQGKLAEECLKLLQDKKRQENYAGNIEKMAGPDAANQIVDEIIKIIQAHD